MTLDETIKHCLEEAEEQSRLYSLCPCPCDGTDNCMSLKNGKDMGCTKCAAEHRQLAEWLTELKDLKEQIKEYKRLLKSATIVLNTFKPCDNDYNCSECIHQRQNCDYISREELIKALEADYNRSWCSKPQGVEEYVEGARDEYDDVLKIVCAMPTTDVQPVNHGRWECVGHDDTTNWYRCTVCGHEEHDNMTKHDSHCGSCGTRMDLKESEQNG